MAHSSPLFTTWYALHVLIAPGWGVTVAEGARDVDVPMVGVTGLVARVGEVVVLDDSGPVPRQTARCSSLLSPANSPVLQSPVPIHGFNSTSLASERSEPSVIEEHSKPESVGQLRLATGGTTAGIMYPRPLCHVSRSSNCNQTQYPS